MKFKGQPGLFVKISNKYIQRATSKKGLFFNENGEYETENPILIKALSQNFETVQEENVAEIAAEEIMETKKTFKCKKCDFVTDNQGVLMRHYKEHKKEA